MSSKRCSEENVSPLIWDHSFSVKAPILDSQHRSLFQIINQLQAACSAGAEKELLLKIIKDLYNYSTTHFRDEETLLKQKHSPLLADQEMQHALFLDYVIDLEAKVKSGSSTVNDEILTFLKVWWEEHILKIDKQYAELF